MKTIASKLALLICLAVAPSASAVVGYINLSIYPGENLIANQLISGNDTLDNLFSSKTSVQGVSNGSLFTMWDPVANKFTPNSVYNAVSDTWSINYPFSYGQGGLLYSPSASTWVNTLVGQVPNYNPVTSTPWQPNYANGLYLISSAVPISGPMDAMFTNVVGRLPVNGEMVEILNPATQTATITTFQSGLGWDNGNRSLAVGESAWFNLGPVEAQFPVFVVPEPSLLALVGLGAVGLFTLGRRKA
jgi:hypothetical protein